MPWKLRAWPWLAVLIALMISAALLQITTWQQDVGKSDIYYIYLDGQRLMDGQNPYARVLEGNMRENDKYTTYFPAFIELAYLTQRLGLPDFDAWLLFWRWIFLLCNLGITALLFWVFYSSGKPLVGIFMSLFWAFNRWTLFIVRISGMDFLPLLLLLISLLLLERNRQRWLALLLFGLSLAMKQIAIFLVPLFLISAYQSATGRAVEQKPRAGVRAGLLAGLAIGAPVLLTSLPFLLWNLKGFVKSIAFSVTRSQYQFAPVAASLDMYLDLNGFAARLPMLAAIALVYWAAWRGSLRLLPAAALVMAVFTGFNPVYFDQYMVWFILLLPLALVNFAENRPPAVSTG